MSSEKRKPMKFIKQVINLWRIQKSKNPYDKGLIRHLSVNPNDRAAVKEWHIGQKVTGTETQL